MLITRKVAVMPKAYWIAHVTVTDPDQYKHYAGDAPVAFKKYGAIFLARGGAFVQQLPHLSFGLWLRVDNYQP